MAQTRWMLLSGVAFRTPGIRQHAGFIYPYNKQSARFATSDGAPQPTLTTRKARRSEKIETLAIHGGEQHDPGNGAIFPPITTATSFVQPSFGESGRFCYSRSANPTRHAYETALADLEGGISCVATASGMAATALALELLESGSHIIVMSGVYGGTFRLFEKVRRFSMGLDFTYLDLNVVESVCESLRPNTRMIWIETPTNPLLDLVDIQKLAQAVKAKCESDPCEKQRDPSRRILICVDNTFATAWNQQPLKLGADLVMISSSKFIGGHSDMTGGALVTNDEGIAERLAFLNSAVGTIAGPFDAYLALRGMKTLAVRMERQCSNAARVAKFLERHERVEQVHYPGLLSHPQHDLCRRQMRTGGSVVTIRLRTEANGDDDQAIMNTFFERLRIWVLVESLGGVESMINHSASMSHHSMTREARA
eukprot:CAMPEP_0117500124 /NCGR_PEP_ID=MMETSP0784-20121206/22609_1 /TAXON_ID=39447 /ORGANISM="" /LENGTH=424 /DNA_ID=CAMNT_0005295313 /DNA_START=26 /DNA_END=1296 /DNA_ORIENTATION=-